MAIKIYEFDTAEEAIAVLKHIHPSDAVVLTGNSGEYIPPKDIRATATAKVVPPRAPVQPAAIEPKSARVTAGLVSEAGGEETNIERYMTRVRAFLKTNGQAALTSAMIKAGHVDAAGDALGPKQRLAVDDEGSLSVQTGVPDEETRDKILAAIEEIALLSQIKGAKSASSTVETDKTSSPEPLTKEAYLAAMDLHLKAINNNPAVAVLMKEIGHVNPEGKGLHPKSAPEKIWSSVLAQLDALAAKKAAA